MGSKPGRDPDIERLAKVITILVMIVVTLGLAHLVLWLIVRLIGLFS